MAKQRLVEHLLVSIPKENIQIYTDGKEHLIESKGESYPARGVLRNVPVTKFVENLNGRVYPKPLWERVEKTGLFEGSPCGADHAEEEGSVKNLVGVWHGFKVKEDHACADLYCIGDLGSLLLEYVTAKGKAGFSTVGFGEFLNEQSNTVNPETYEYEQTDWVKSPSQQVFATSENLVIDKDKADTEISEDTNKKEEIIRLKKITESKEDTKMDKYQELTLRNNLSESIRMAKKSENLREAIETIQGLAIPEEFGDIRKNAEGVIIDLQAKLEEQKQVAEVKLNETHTKLVSLEEKYSKAKAVLDKAGLSEDMNIDELKESVQKMSEALKVARVNEAEMLKDLAVIDKVFAHKLARKMEIEKPRDIVALMEDTVARDGDLKYLLDEMKKYKKQLQLAENRIGIYEKELSKRGFLFEDDAPETDEDEDEDEKEDEKKAESRKRKREALKRRKREQDETGAGVVTDEGEIEEQDDDEDDESDEALDEPITASESYRFKFRNRLNEEDDEEEDDEDEDDEDEEKEESKKESHRRKTRRWVEEDDDEDEDEEEDDDEEKMTEEEGGEASEEDMEHDQLNPDMPTTSLPEAKKRRKEMKRRRKEEEGGEASEEDMEHDQLNPDMPTNSLPEAKRIRRDIKTLLVREIKKNPSLRDVAGHIMKSRSLTEAIAKIDKFDKKTSSKKQDGIRLNESTFTGEKPLWLGNRK